MTAPTPPPHNPEPSQPSSQAGGRPDAGQHADGSHATPAAPAAPADPSAPYGHGGPYANGDPYAYGGPGGAGAGGVDAAYIGREARDSVLCALGVAVVGVLLGLLWVWLAPRVPLFTDGKAVYLKDPEGEEAIGADGTFALLGLAFGAVTGVLVYFLRRRGGVGIVVGLVVGGVLGSLLAWRTGLWLGPETDVVRAAKEAGKNATFDAPLKLQAKGVLLTWPFAAAALHLLFTAIFLPPEEEPAAGRSAAVVQAPPEWDENPRR